LGENNELKNRYMLINGPEGWKATDDKKQNTDDKPTIILAYFFPLTSTLPINDKNATYRVGQALHVAFYF